MSYQIVEAKQECYVNDDCATPDVCNKGSCINACRLSQCGSNAIVNQVFIQQNAFVCLVLLEIHNTPVTNVSCFQDELCQKYSFSSIREVLCITS